MDAEKRCKMRGKCTGKRYMVKVILFDEEYNEMSR